MITISIFSALIQAPMNNFCNVLLVTIIILFCSFYKVVRKYGVMFIF